MPSVNILQIGVQHPFLPFNEKRKGKVPKEIEMKMTKSTLFTSTLITLILALSLQGVAFAQGTGPGATIERDGISLFSTEESIAVGDTITYTVFLQNLPTGVTGAEFVCSYNETYVDVANVETINLPGGSVSLFGADAVTATNTPAAGSFTYAIASMPPNTAGTTGGLFSLDITGQASGSFDFTCAVRIARGTILTTIGFTPLTITVTAPATEGVVSGRVLAHSSVYNGTKTVTINITDSGSVDLDDTLDLGAGGTFSFNVAPGTYTVTATAPGYLKAEGSVTVVAGDTISMENLTLLAGDIDANDDINFLDVASIGANYNLTTPSAADLNGSGRINLLDLQLLAPNYGIVGPEVWAEIP
jgi:hypothetical protein